MFMIKVILMDIHYSYLHGYRNRRFLCLAKLSLMGGSLILV